MGKVPKVVIDSNVFISAFGWGGRPLKVVELLEKQKIQNSTSEDMLRELGLSLSYPKLAFPKGLQSGVLEFVLACSDVYEPKKRLHVTADPDDNKLLECALAAGAEYVITGDKGLLAVGRFQGIEVLSPAGFLKRIKK